LLNNTGVANKAIGYHDPPGSVLDPAPSIILNEKLDFAIQILQVIGLAIIKISALAFYRRIFCSIKPSPLNTIIWVLIFVCVAWGIAFVGFYAGACGSHPSAQWSGTIEFLEYCIDLDPKFEKGFAASDFILDTLVLIVPIPSVWNLKISTGRRIGVTGIFMLALIGYGACIARLATNVILASANYTGAPPDVQLATTQAIWFSMLETGFAIIAVNLPSLWSIIAKVSPISLIRSLRSFITLGSVGSEHGSRGQFSGRTYHRKSSLASTSNQDISLVPQSGGDCTITIERQMGKEGSTRTYEQDLESGIHVKQSLKIETTSQA